MKYGKARDPLRDFRIAWQWTMPSRGVSRMPPTIAWEIMSETTITARGRSNNVLARIMPDGSEQPFPHAPMRDTTDEEIEQAALADPDS